MYEGTELVSELTVDINFINLQEILIQRIDGSEFCYILLIFYWESL